MELVAISAELEQLLAEAEARIDPQVELAQIPAVELTRLLRAVRAHQEELAAQNEELQQTHAELALANEELRVSNLEVGQSRDRYLDLYEVAPVGYATLDERGLVLGANRRLAQMVGLEREALIGRRLAELVAEEDQDDFFLNLRGLLAAEQDASATVDLRLRRSDQPLWVRSSWIVVPGKDCRRFRVALSDITEYKQMQAQLAHADRMSSLGLLAAGVAHEINNPLTYVLYNAGRVAELVAGLERHLAPGSPGLIDLREIAELARSAEEGAGRIREIVKHLRVFSHVDDDRVVALDLHGVIDSAIDMAFNQLKYRAQLTKRYARDMPQIIANSGHLCQVFLNLLVNAAQAIEEGDVGANEIRVHTRHDPDKDEVVVEVSDTGSGIPPAIIDRIFDPFFTTKDVGAGSGLGLSICHKIIASYDGALTVDSTEGRGSRFVVRLPVVRQVAPEVPVPASITGNHGLCGRILVIDDEPAVAEVLAAMLAMHEVVVAHSGLAGREHIEAGEHFDVILCDLMMPNQTGMDLHGWLLEQQPKLAERMVFITGGVFTPRARKLLAEVPNLHLEKPFSPRDLRAIVQKLLASGATRPEGGRSEA